MDLISRDEDKHGDDDGAEKIHHWRSDDRSAHPAHVFTKQAPRRFTELGDFECLHAESFHHTIAGDGFLKDLAEFAKARLAVFGRAANLATELVHRKND